jgi:hypothetical protein
MSKILTGGTLVEDGDIIEITIECCNCHHRYSNVAVSKNYFARPALLCGKCGWQIPLNWKQELRAT